MPTDTITTTFTPEVKRAIVHAWDHGLSPEETGALLQLGESIVKLEFARLDAMHRVFIEDACLYL